MDVRHDVSPIGHQGGIPGHSQGDMKDRAVFGGVDPLAGEHRVAAFSHASASGHAQQRGERISIDSVLRVVEDKFAGRGCHRIASARISLEELPEVAIPDPFEVTDHCQPLVASHQVDDVRSVGRCVASALSRAVHLQSPPSSSCTEEGAVPDLRQLDTTRGRNSRMITVR